MPRTDPDFGTRLVSLVLAYARSQRVDLARYFAKYKVPADLNLDQPGREEVLTTVGAARAMMEELADELKDAHLGLSLARWLPRGSYGVAEFLMRSAATVRQTFENVVRFNALLAPSQTFRFEVTATEGLLSNYLTVQPGGLGRHQHEYATAALADSLRAIAPVRFTRVWFCNPSPPDLPTLSAFFGGAPLEFDQPANGFALPLADLDAPLKSADPALYAYLEEHAVTALASRPKVDELIDQLRHAIREALKTGEPNIERLATKLHLSGRTLQRRLAELKTSFQDVLDGVRFDLARVYLRDERLDISQVAYLLGYSELRAFDRAFKRWAGVAPREWRQKPTS